LADLGRLDLARVVNLVLERTRRSRCVLVGQALLEALHALGDVAHQIGNLASPEQEDDYEDDDQPVPDAEGTHQRLLQFLAKGPFSAIPRRKEPVPSFNGTIADASRRRDEPRPRM